MDKTIVSKTRIKNKARRKTNLELVETIRLAMKHKPWVLLAHNLSGPTRKQSRINLSEIDNKTQPGDTIIIPGKVLSEGNITKKLRICALSFSNSAREKMKATKSEAVSILQEIKINPKAEGVKILQ